MRKKLLLLLFFILPFCGGDFVFGQTQIKNNSKLSNSIVAAKVAFIDSVRQANKSKQQADITRYKVMIEDGYSRKYVDSLRHEEDPSFSIPVYYIDPDAAEQEPPHGKYNDEKPLINIHSSNKGGDPPVPLITGPEQNCPGAIAVCSQTYTQASSYTGYGYQEVYGTCLKQKEQYSVWYVFTAQSSGTFGFDLATLKDYDFALYNLTTIGGCSNINASNKPIRCNYSSTYGNTGLTPSSTSELPELSVSASGAPYMTGVQVTAGNTYALIIDNFTMDATGYTLTFNGTSSIFDNSPPTLSSVVNNCNNTVALTFSEPVKCNTIAGNGSDFTITGPAAMSVSAASGCTAGTLTNTITLTVSTSATSGVYTIHVQNGSDGNTVHDKCGNAMSTAQTINFNYLAPVTISCSPASGIVCQGNSAVLTVNGAPAGATFAWNPAGGTTNPSAAVTPNASTIYDVTLSYGGCTNNTSYTVTVQSNPVVSISPSNPILCSGTTNLTAGANPCSGCTYAWTGSAPAPASGATLSGCGAGTYNVVATSSGGCVSNTATSTVSLASSPPANYCSIYYVTPTGAGTADGTSIANAASTATLPTVLSSIGCGGATIKMAVGTYAISSPLNINGNTTIEGGYKDDASFSVKYSMDNSSPTTTYTTIIRRSNANPDASYNIIALSVAASSSNFRLQDLRIELPGATPLANNPINPAASNQNNYGIYLGAGCSNYNIVRCYIDGGKGAN